MKLKILFLSCFFLNSTFLFSQLTISGTLYGEKNESLAFALVSITHLEKDSSQQITTNIDGEFIIELSLKGLYSIEFEYVGYQSNSFEFELNQDTVINQKLALLPYVLEEIHVVGYKVPLIDRGLPADTIVRKVAKDCEIDSIRRKGLLKPQEAYQFLKDYLTYPAYSISEEEEGRLYAQFSIDSIGNISSIQIRKGYTECLENMIKSALICMPPVVMLDEGSNYGYDNYNKGFEVGEYLLPVRFELR
ncbi:MAG: carboxypeptidase-like regulatory domain-containing protein [Crocinitomicaceae bacterium]